MADDSSSMLDANDPTSYVDLGRGLVTSSREWYHVTEEALREYAGEVFDHVSLGQVLAWSDVWVRSARTVAVWSLPVFLWWTPPIGAVLGTLVIYAAWDVLSPSFPSLWLVRGLAWMQNAVAQGLYYVLVLSILAPQTSVATVSVGLLGFILLRWGLVDRAWAPLRRVLHPKVYALPVNDQVLRGFILRIALKHRLSLPQLDAMAEDILENWGSHSDTNDSP